MFLASCSLGLSLSGHFKFLWLTGFASLALTIYTFINIQSNSGQLGLGNAIEFDWGWGFLMLGVLLIATSASLRSNEEIWGEQVTAVKKPTFEPPKLTTKCPQCDEEIKVETKVCYFCGHTFSDIEVNANIENAKKEFEENEAARKKADERLKQIRERRGW